jgi:hypothetical protein
VIIQAASYYGIPLSTTKVITASIMGVGARKTFQRRAMDSCRANHMGTGFHFAGKRADRLCARACRSSSALTKRKSHARV